MDIRQYVTGGRLEVTFSELSVKALRMPKELVVGCVFFFSYGFPFFGREAVEHILAAGAKKSTLN